MTPSLWTTLLSSMNLVRRAMWSPWAFKTARLDSLEVFQQWWDLDEALRQVQVPVDSVPVMAPLGRSMWSTVFSDSGPLSRLVRKDDPKSFVMEPVISRRPETQAELDSVMGVLRSMPFYEGFLHTELGATIQMVYVNAPLFNSENRGRSVELLVEEVERFEKASRGGRTRFWTPLHPHRSHHQRSNASWVCSSAWLPPVTALLLLLFFRNIVVMMVCMMVVGTGVVWSLGSIVLFDYKLTALMGLIPPLMIVIGVPNCIYLLEQIPRGIQAARQQRARPDPNGQKGRQRDIHDQCHDSFGLCGIHVHHERCPAAVRCDCLAQHPGDVLHFAARSFLRFSVGCRLRAAAMCGTWTGGGCSWWCSGSSVRSATTASGVHRAPSVFWRWADSASP